MEQEDIDLLTKTRLRKEYKRIYYSCVRKDKYTKCDWCNIDLKINSLHYHHKSKRHLFHKHRITEIINKYIS